MAKLKAHTFIKTGKLNANASSINGKYPFFTCSKDVLSIDTYSYDCECVLVAGNGDLNVKYYNGKFDAYQRTYIIESNDKSKLNVRYLYYFLEHYVEKLRQDSIGGVIKYIKLANLEQANIPLPLIKEQEKISYIFSKIDSLIKIRENQIQKIQDIIRSRFMEFLKENKNSIEYKQLKDICSLITDGTHQSPKFQMKGIPFLFVSNINTNEINYESNKFIDCDTYEKLIQRTPIELGDILLSIVGSYGHPAIVKSTKKFCFQRHIAYLKPKSNIINSTYLHTAILSDYVQKQISDKVKGIAQKTLNLSELKTITIPLISIEDQAKIYELVLKVDKSKYLSAEQLLLLKKIFSIP